MRLLLILVAIGLSFSLNAQKISGLIRDDQGKVIPSATVMLKRSKDSSVAKLTSSNASGEYQFVAATEGEYFIGVTHVGYAETNSPVFNWNGIEDLRINEIRVDKASTNLAAVTVTAKKPIVEVKADKTILNVEGTINAIGSDALELLRKSPGVLVDRDDNISLSGKNGVQVYIDGRPTPLAGKDLADFLKSLNSNAIEAIEIITNPSAKYDAAGNAGIINIRLKKNKTFGTNGSITAGTAIGQTVRYNGGFALNHRNEFFNVFGNYNYNRNRNKNKMRLDRVVADTSFDQRSNMEFSGHTHNFKVGADYFINRFNTLGAIVTGNISENQFKNFSRTPIVYIPTNETDRILIADNTNAMERTNLNFNLNYRFADTTGHEFNVDADYGRYDLKSNQFQPNYYLDPSTEQLLYSVVNNMIAPTNLNIYTFKADYEQNFAKGRLGIGGKFAVINSDNTFERYNVNGANKDLDVNRSNFFEYRENINAVYLNFNRQLKPFMFQVGVRMENTSTDGDSFGLNADGSINTASKTTFTRDYTDFFPSAAITFNKNPMSQWNFTYSRRIDRPAYQDLNPFEFKLDEYTFQKGNTELLPQYTNSFAVTHTYKYKLNTTINYSKVNDIFAQLVDTADKSKSFITKKNLATQDIVSLNISYPLSIKKFTAFMNLNAYYSHYVADFGPESREIDLDVTAFTYFMQNSYQFGKGFTAELSGWYSSPSIWQGTFKSKEMWSIDAGLQKQILQNKGNIKVSVSDIFKTMKWRGESDFAGQTIVASGEWDSRLFKVAFTWRFGNTQVKAARQRSTGADDENKRVQQGGGGIGQ